MKKNKLIIFLSVLVIFLIFLNSSFAEDTPVKNIAFQAGGNTIKISGDITPYDTENNGKGYLILDSVPVFIKITGTGLTGESNMNLGGYLEDNVLYAIFNKPGNFLGYNFEKNSQISYDFENKILHLYEGSAEIFGKKIIAIDPVIITKDSIEITDAYVSEGSNQQARLTGDFLINLLQDKIIVDKEIQQNSEGQIENGKNEFVFLDKETYLTESQSSFDSIAMDLGKNDLKIADSRGSPSEQISLGCPEEETGMTGAVIAEIPALAKSNCRLNSYRETNAYNIITGIDWSKRSYFKIGDSGEEGSKDYETILTIQKIVGANPDGKYGSETFSKVQAWQKKYNSDRGFKYPDDKSKGAIGEDGLWGAETSLAFLSTAPQGIQLEKWFNGVKAKLSSLVSKRKPTAVTPTSRIPVQQTGAIQIKSVYIVSSDKDIKTPAYLHGVGGGTGPGWSNKNKLVETTATQGLEENIYLTIVIKDQKNNFYAGPSDTQSKKYGLDKASPLYPFSSLYFYGSAYVIDGQRIEENMNYPEQKKSGTFLKGDLGFLEDWGYKILWYKIIPEVSHQGYLSKISKSQDDYCPRDPDLPNIKTYSPYCWYQNLRSTDTLGRNLLWRTGSSGSSDIMHYKKVFIGSNLKIQNIETGVTRYLVEIIDRSGNLVTSSPGETSDKTIHGLEEKYYDYSLGGISEKVHKIVRTSTFSIKNAAKCAGNEFGCKFIDYAEAQYGSVWIYGAKSTQADHEIGMECSDLVRAALRDMGYKKIGIGEPGVNDLLSFSSARVEGKFHGGENGVWTDRSDSSKKKIEVGNGPNQVHVGDLLLVDDNSDSKLDHTLIFLSDSGSVPGYLDDLDTVLNMGHRMIMPPIIPRGITNLGQGILQKVTNGLANLQILPRSALPDDTWGMISQRALPAGLDKETYLSHALYPRLIIGCSSLRSDGFGYFIIRKIDQSKI